MERKILFMSPAWSSQGKAAEGGSQASPLPLFLAGAVERGCHPTATQKRGERIKMPYTKRGETYLSLPVFFRNCPPGRALGTFLNKLQRRRFGKQVLSEGGRR